MEMCDITKNKDNLFEYLFLNGHRLLDSLTPYTDAYKNTRIMTLSEMIDNKIAKKKLFKKDEYKFKYDVYKVFDDKLFKDMREAVQTLEKYYIDSYTNYHMEGPITYYNKNILNTLLSFIQFKHIVYDYKYRIKHNDDDNTIKIFKNDTYYILTFEEIEVPYTDSSILDDNFNSKTTTDYKVTLLISSDPKNDNDPTKYIYMLNHEISFDYSMSSFVLFKQSIDIIYRATLNAFYEIMSNVANRYRKYRLADIKFNEWFEEDIYVVNKSSSHS